METHDWGWERRWTPQAPSAVLTRLGLCVESSTSSLLTFDQLREERLLVLLGEPGSGKSYEAERIRDKLAECQENVLFLDGKRTIHSDTSLIRSWIDSPEWQEWVKSEQVLTVVFDAFDESRSHFSNLSGLIVEQLQRQFQADARAQERLRFWVLSRPIGWDFALGTDLKRLFYPDVDHLTLSYEYRLIPPRRTDIEAAAKAVLSNSSDFLDELSRRHLWPLTARPKNLSWLLRLFMQRQELPEDQIELFQYGVVDAANDTQFGARSDRDVAIAARMAFVYMFSESLSICRANLPDGKDSQLDLWSLEGYQEHTLAGDVSVTKDELHRALHCGLFSAISESEFVWSHQTYPEFLAGKYLADLSWPVQQKANLLTNPLDLDQHILPNLTEVAAWAAAVDNSLMEELLRRDPEQLLLSDVAFGEATVRNRVCEAVLNGLERGSIVPTHWYSKDKLQRLKSPSLQHVLRPYITDQSLKTKTRDIAIQIAQAARVEGLIESALEIALCRDEVRYLRASAAYLVRDLGSVDERRRLLDLLSEDGESFEMQNLRGCALQANWPQSVSLDTILNTFVEPVDSTIGAYQQFINYQFLQELPGNLIPDLFEWWQRQTVWSRTTYDAERFEENLIDKATSALETPDVQNCLVGYLVDRINHDHILFRRNRLPEKLRLKFDAPNIRHQVIGTFAEKLIEEQSERASLSYVYDLYGHDPELVSRDMGWAKAQVTESESTVARRFWLRFLIGCKLPVSLEALWELSPQLQAEKLEREALGPVSFTSQEAETARQTWRMFHGDPSAEDDDDPQPSLNVLVSNYCQLAETTHPSWWWKIDEVIQSQGHSSFPLDSGTPSMTLLPAWNDVSKENQQRIVELALPYLRDFSTDDHDIRWSQPALAAVRAVGLLSDLDESMLSQIGNHVWRALGPAFACFGLGYDFRETQYINRSLRECVDSGFDIQSWVVELANRRKSDVPGDLYNALRNCKQFWDQATVGELISSLISNGSGMSALRAAFGALDDDLTPAILGDVLAYADAIDASSAELGPLLASSLVTGSDQMWEIMKPRLEASKELFQATLYSYDQNDLGSRRFSRALSARTLADLYVLTVKAFPPSGDGHKIGPHTVSPRESVGILREEILQQIVRIGSWAAVAELERIQPLIPEVTWLTHSVAEAKDNARMATRQPMSVQALMDIIRSRDVRIVRSAAELKQVVLTELSNLEVRLHGENLLVHTLWNIMSGPQAGAHSEVNIPKRETLVASTIRGFIHEQLERRHVVYNREVENREGDEIDALFQYQDPHTFDVFAVPCEIKCCYNATVLTAMASQLFERYMRNQGHKVGIYLVPFFDCPAWSEENYNRFHQASRGHSIEEVQSELDAGAASLSQDGFEITPVVLDCRLQ